MRRITLLLFVLSAITLVWSKDSVSAKLVAEARCAIPTFDKEYKASKAVFVGKVVGMKKDGNAKIFKFKVEKFWKGVDSKTLSVKVHENPRYQAQYKVDGRFLVFAKHNEDMGLWDGRCSRSKDIEGFGGIVKEDLKKLGEAKTCISLEDQP